MPRWIKVTFHDTSDIHKLRNCTEDLSLTINRSPYGSLPFDEAEAVDDHVRIVNIPARKLRRAIALVENLLREHFYDSSTTITTGRMSELGVRPERRT